MPDEEERVRDDWGTRPEFPQRYKGAVPDRWIYDLFKAQMSTEEIGKRTGLAGEWARARVAQLERAGYITAEERRRRHAHIERIARGPGKYCPARIHKTNESRYQAVIRAFQKTQIIAAVAKETNTPLGTVSRWVRRWEKENEELV